VLIVPDLDAAERFFTAALGFGCRTPSWTGASRSASSTAPAGPPATTRWGWPRPGMVGIHHLCSRSGPDDVGTALDEINARQIPLAMSLGRHPNDLVTSSTCAPFGL